MGEHLWRIYRYRNVLTDENYIGQTTKNVNDRAGNGYGYRKGSKFRTAIDRYGWDNFEQSILRLCISQEDANYWEKYFIDKFDSINNGYNSQDGGNGGCALGKHWNHTEEAHRKIADSMKEVMKNPEVRQKMADSKKGDKNPMKRPEVRKKLSDSKKGKPGCNKGRKFFNNGVKNVMAYECPEGYVPGRIYQRRTI